MARATRRPSPSSSRTGSASPSSRSRSSTATPRKIPYGMGTYGSRSLAVGGTAHRQGDGQGGRQGPQDRRPSARGGRGRCRVQGRQVHGRRHRPVEDLGRGGADRLCAAQLPASRSSSRASTRPRSTTRRTSPSRPAPTSPRSRSTPRPARRARQLHRRRRFRAHHQPDDRRGPGPWRRSPRASARRCSKNCVYDKETGQLLTGSYKDYCMPRADDFAAFKLVDQRDAVHAQPARRQGLRRGRRDRRAGRRSSTPSSTRWRRSAIRHLDMPATPERLWRRSSQAPLAARRGIGRARCTNSTTTSRRASTRSRTCSAPNEEAKLVAGGMTLIPTLKLRLARPSDLVDLAAIPSLRGITDAGDAIVIGAMTRHAEVRNSPVVKQAIPALGRDGRDDRRPGGAQPRHDRRLDQQQRPGRRLPGGAGRARRHRADDQARRSRPRISSPACSRRRSSRARSSPRCVSRSRRPACYQKFRNPASRYAIVGVFVARTAGGVRVAVTGAGPWYSASRRWKRRSPNPSRRTRSRTSRSPIRPQLRHPCQRRIPRPPRRRHGPPRRRGLRQHEQCVDGSQLSLAAPARAETHRLSPEWRFALVQLVSCLSKARRSARKSLEALAAPMKLIVAHARSAG